MTREDFAYAAGLLDGEGYFSHVDSGRIRCDMTDIAPVLWLHDTFGGSFNGPFQYREDRLPVWKWTLCRIAAREEFILGILPYLKVKQAKAAAMLELLRHSSTKPPIRGGRRPNDTPEWLEWYAGRERLRQALRDA